MSEPKNYGYTGPPVSDDEGRTNMDENTTLCEAQLTEPEDGSHWLCIRTKHDGHEHQWAPDTSRLPFANPAQKVDAGTAALETARENLSLQFIINWAVDKLAANRDVRG